MRFAKYSMGYFALVLVLCAAQYSVADDASLFAWLKGKVQDSKDLMSDNCAARDAITAAIDGARDECEDTYEGVEHLLDTSERSDYLQTNNGICVNQEPEWYEDELSMMATLVGQFNFHAGEVDDMIADIEFYWYFPWPYDRHNAILVAIDEWSTEMDDRATWMEARLADESAEISGEIITAWEELEELVIYYANN